MYLMNRNEGVTFTPISPQNFVNFRVTPESPKGTFCSDIIRESLSDTVKESTMDLKQNVDRSNFLFKTIQSVH